MAQIEKKIHENKAETHYRRSRLLLYSLISIRQNYNYDMIAMIWHEIVGWFLTIYQDLKRFATEEHRIVYVLTFRCTKQFYVPNMQERSKVGKTSEINRQTLVIWWLNSRRYRSVWYIFSCKEFHYHLLLRQNSDQKSWKVNNGVVFPKLFWLTVRKNVLVTNKNCFKFTRTIYSNTSLKGQHNFWNRILFWFVPEGFSALIY